MSIASSLSIEASRFRVSSSVSRKTVSAPASGASSATYGIFSSTLAGTVLLVAIMSATPADPPPPPVATLVSLTPSFPYSL